MDAQTGNFILPRASELPITNGAEFGSELAAGIKEYVNRKLVPLEDRIKQLEATIVRLQAEIEQRNFTYHGVWKENAVYGVGSFATHNGALWHSNIFHNTTRPGDGNVSWTLAVKSGRDGKDGAPR